jgi:hypothetical protein
MQEEGPLPIRRLELHAIVNSVCYYETLYIQALLKPVPPELNTTIHHALNATE